MSISENARPQATSPNQLALAITELSFAYPAASLVLDRVSLEVEPHERLAIVGPSGAGKSTLLMHLNGLLPARAKLLGTTGTVTVGSRKLDQSSLPEIRRMVGLVFQDPDDQLFCPTVEDDIAFGPRNLGLSREEITQRVEESLDAVGLLEARTRSTLQLSYGERKRACLAGILACQPQILALDEPSANLDPKNRRTLIELIHRFSGTTIIATHDLELVTELCHRVAILDRGRIQACGRTRELLSDASLLEQHGLEVPLSLKCDCGDHPPKL